MWPCLHKCDVCVHGGWVSLPSEMQRTWLRTLRTPSSMSSPVTSRPKVRQWEPLFVAIFFSWKVNELSEDLNGDWDTVTCRHLSCIHYAGSSETADKVLMKMREDGRYILDIWGWFRKNPSQLLTSNYMADIHYLSFYITYGISFLWCSTCRRESAVSRHSL